MCAGALIVSGLPPTTRFRNLKEAATRADGIRHQLQRHHSGRRIRLAPLSCDSRHGQESVADLQQAHDLLPAVYPNAGGNSRHLDYFHARRRPEVSLTVGGWNTIRSEPTVSNPGKARGN